MAAGLRSPLQTGRVELSRAKRPSNRGAPRPAAALEGLAVSYIRVDKGLTSKPKFRRIQRLTGLSVPTLIGHLNLIWMAVDELGEDFQGDDIDIAEAVSAPVCAQTAQNSAPSAQSAQTSALLCAMLEVGWATRFEGGISFHSNDPSAQDRTEAHRARAARSYERKKGILRAEAQNSARSAPPPSPRPAPPLPTPPDSLCAPTRDAKPSRSKPKDPIAWNAQDGWQGITDEDRNAWGKAYPACNIERQLAAADQWLRANPKRATKSRWRAFVVNWLSRSQDRGGDERGQRVPNPTPDRPPNKPTVEQKANALADLLRNAPSRRMT